MRYSAREQDFHGAPSRIGVLLINVGTPAAPTPEAVRPYLAEFLGDPRIIELTPWIWKPVLHGIILRTRPKRSAQLYANVWTEVGSPLLDILRKQAAGLQALLTSELQDRVVVEIGLRYGEPSIAQGLRRLRDAGAQRIVIFPLYPQYSATTTATSFDAVFDELKRWRWVPALRTIQNYHDRPAYIEALAQSVEQHWAQQGRAARLLISFHGIPRSYFLKGDPYYCECQKSARLLAKRLNLTQGEYAVTFQSRFGPVEWLQPYTDVTVEEWGKQKLPSVQAICPGFSADCLETVDEVGREAKHVFQEAGGGDFQYIPALNDRGSHLRALAGIVLENLHGWLDEPAAPPLSRHEVEALMPHHKQALGIRAAHEGAHA